MTDDALFSRKVESDLRSEQIPQEAWSELCGVSELNDQNAYEFLRERKNIVLKLLSGDTGVGTIILDALGDKDTEVIRYFYIMPQYRRRGFGTQMLGRAFRIGRSKAKRYVEIELPYDNQDVANFFEKNGFLLYGNGCAFNHTMRKDIKYFSQASMLPPI